MDRMAWIGGLLLFVLADAGTRVTWNNCTCKSSWTGCNDSCCNTDNDPHGAWCMVTDTTCEDSDWGYCYPEDTCRDEIDWADDMGLGCIDYAQNRYCTSDGKYGLGWNKEWGKFEDYSDWQGNTALKICCACGGGEDLSPKLVGHGVACFDYTWVDASGDSCGTYMSLGYCTKRGEPGPGWHDEWGNFDTFKAPGNVTMGRKNRTQHTQMNATRACCACGGGMSRKVQPKKSTWLKNNKDKQKEKFEQIRKQARQTWNGCKCKQMWKDADTHSGCDSYCCNKDRDPYGQWCMVEDKSCEDAEWGYCRPPPGVEYNTHNENSFKFRLCKDRPLWHDLDGDSCDEYASRMWCNRRGHYDVGWHQEEWGTFEEFASNGVDATDACCACGGGNNSGLGPLGGVMPQATKKFDFIKQAVLDKLKEANSQPRETWAKCQCKKKWKDQQTGFQCDNYCCNPDSDNNGPWCQVQSGECEESDWGYCKPVVIPLLEYKKETCSNAPTDYEDKLGNTCEDYEKDKLCNATGGPGIGWNPNWGSFDEVSKHPEHNQNAYTACCACGGGVRAPALKHCVNMPFWTDKEGDTCDSYYALNWCKAPNYSIDADGGSRYGKGWKDDWGSFGDFRMNGNGLSPLEACCACGGGLIGKKESQTRMERALELGQELIEESYGAVLFVPALLCSCCVGIAFCMWRRSKIPIEELPAAATHVARKYGKFDDGSV